MREHKNKNATIIVLFMILFAFSIQNAYAYIDLGTGSYILQAGIAVVLGAILSFKVFWRKIIGKFSKILSKGKKT